MAYEDFETQGKTQKTYNLQNAFGEESLWNSENKTQSKAPKMEQQKNDSGTQDRSLLSEAVQGKKPVSARSALAKAGQDIEVPEKYQIIFDDGMSCDEELLERATPIFKALGLTQYQAQQLAELHASHVRKVEQSYVQLIQGWREAARQDSEIGGADFAKKLGVMAKAAKTFGSKALLEVLDSSGVGNHPEVLRFFYRIGCALEQDGFMHSAQARKSVDPISLVYPNHKPY